LFGSHPWSYLITLKIKGPKWGYQEFYRHKITFFSLKPWFVPWEWVLVCETLNVNLFLLLEKWFPIEGLLWFIEMEHMVYDPQRPMIPYERIVWWPRAPHNSHWYCIWILWELSHKDDGKKSGNGVPMNTLMFSKMCMCSWASIFDIPWTTTKDITLILDRIS
jgi:hypothetical protein